MNRKLHKKADNKSICIIYKMIVSRSKSICLVRLFHSEGFFFELRKQTKIEDVVKTEIPLLGEIICPMNFCFFLFRGFRFFQ